MDFDPKELCDLGVCTSHAEARRRIYMCDQARSYDSLYEAVIEAQRQRTKELEAERDRRIKGMAQMCDFMQHKAACLSLNGDKNTCDCGMSMALMIAMNPHMDIATDDESEAE